ncbi:MAG: hypothetical protein ACLQPD_08205 [Desulfomonilaceae bacterium]
MTKTVKDVLANLSPRIIVFTGFVLTAVVGWVDFITGYEVSISILYLGPISLVAWYAGRAPGFLVAVTSAIVWLLADVAAGHTFGRMMIPYWNGAVMLGEFLVVAVIVHWLHVAHERNVRLIRKLREAATKVKTLTGLLPICAWCKKIRTDEGYWQEVEAYIAAHSEAAFTHGICPNCQKEVRKEFPGLRTNRPRKASEDVANEGPSQT